MKDQLNPANPAYPVRLHRLPNGEVELWGLVDGIPHWNDTVRMNEGDYDSAVARLAECFQPGTPYREVLDQLPVAEDYWDDQLYASLRSLTTTLWVVWEEYRGAWTEEIHPIYAPDGDPRPEWNALVAKWRRDAYLEEEAFEEREAFFEEDDGVDTD